MSGDQEAYVEAVLRLVEAVRPGHVTTYGDLAEAVGQGGPRQVGQVLARWGGGVPWWRVVRADGSPARGHEAEALRRLAAEGTPVRGSRVLLRTARELLPEVPGTSAAGSRRDAPPSRHGVGFPSGADV